MHVFSRGPSICKQHKYHYVSSSHLCAYYYVLISDGSIELCGQQLSVVFDPPHLLKGIRNNFLTKDMIFKSKIASWQDIITVYNNNCQLEHTNLNKKLTENHVIPHKIKKMKVSLAAQVLSYKMGAMLEYTALFGK